MAHTADVHNLTSLLDVIENKVDSDEARSDDNDNTTLRDILETIGRRAYGPLLLIIGLISISPASLIPGSTWAFAVLTLLISIQLAFHRKTPWLPSAALNMQVSESKLAGFTRKARPVAKFFDKLIRPRLEFLAEPPFVIGVAIMCVLASLITFPLGLIPLAPMAPGLAIVLFGLGVTARDGVLLLLGTTVMSLAVWVLFTRVF